MGVFKSNKNTRIDILLVKVGFVFKIGFPRLDLDDVAIGITIKQYLKLAAGEQLAGAFDGDAAGEFGSWRIIGVAIFIGGFVYG